MTKVSYKKRKRNVQVYAVTVTVEVSAGGLHTKVEAHSDKELTEESVTAIVEEYVTNAPEGSTIEQVARSMMGNLTLISKSGHLKVWRSHGHMHVRAIELRW